MDEAKRARTAETPKQPCLGLKLRAPYFYPDRGLGRPSPIRARGASNLAGRSEFVNQVAPKFTSRVKRIAGSFGWRCRGRLRLHHGGRGGLHCFLCLTRRELRQR